MVNGIYHGKMPEANNSLIRKYSYVPIQPLDGRALFNPKVRRKQNKGVFNSENELETLILQLAEKIRTEVEINVSAYDRKFASFISHVEDRQVKEKYREKYNNLRNVVVALS